MSEAIRRIYTWGYEGRTVDDLLQVVREHAVGYVCDVRRQARGRVRRGFAPEHLQAALMTVLVDGVAVDYEWLPGLGNAGKTAQWRRPPTAGWDLAVAAANLAGWTQSGLLLCAEADHRECHRTEVAETLANVLRACGFEVEVEHL